MFIVTIVSTLALLFPFLDALGTNSQQGVVITSETHGAAFAIGLLWILTITISTIRKHDHAVECLIDAFGFPGFIGSAMFFGKGLGIHF
jgi:hypothetical protein